MGRRVGPGAADHRWTNLVGVWFSVESALQRDLIDANRAGLDLAHRAYQAELAVAATALAR